MLHTQRDNCALYQFVRLDDFEEFRTPLRALMDDLEIKGTLLLALEGLNGTVAGTQNAIEKLVKFLEDDGRFNHLEIKFSYAQNLPFKRLKVKLKKEIVTLGVQHVDPLASVGTYVKPKDWNALISDPDVLLIDTRNDYEYNIGSFQGAINPNTETFREFPAYTKEHLEQYRDRKVAMFCTGGIRCEKSTAYLKSQGFKEVYHLQCTQRCAKLFKIIKTNKLIQGTNSNHTKIQKQIVLFYHLKCKIRILCLTQFIRQQTLNNLI
jgi:UPF0176 protein